MNLERLSRITVEEGKCGGRPCIRGLRIRVKDVLELLSVAQAIGGKPQGLLAQKRPDWVIVGRRHGPLDGPGRLAEEATE